MTIKELKNFIYENYYRQVWFPKESSHYSIKYQRKIDLLWLAINLTVKIPDATNAKLNYQSYVKRKNTKLVGQSEITITNNYSTTVDIKSVTIEHPKTSHKLSKAIRQGEKKSYAGPCKSSNSPLYSKNLLNAKLAK